MSGGAGTRACRAGTHPGHCRFAIGRRPGDSGRGTHECVRHIKPTSHV